MSRDGVAFFAGREFSCVDGGFAPDEPVEIVVRPEDIKLADQESGMLAGTVEALTFKGVHYEMKVRCGEMAWTLHNTAKAEVGATIGMMILPDDIHVMRKVRR